jgi:tRNA(fMet)-specific endonuclease VapC
MILLDTDHFSVLKYPENPACLRLMERMGDSPDDEFFISVVTAEEQIRGWLAEIARTKRAAAQVVHYDNFADLLVAISRRRVARFDNGAASNFEDLRHQKVRIGSMDLKIAAIALANNALLLSANLRNFGKVPGLRVEDWLGP